MYIQRSMKDEDKKMLIHHQSHDCWINKHWKLQVTSLKPIDCYHPKQILVINREEFTEWVRKLQDTRRLRRILSCRNEAVYLENLKVDIM